MHSFRKLIKELILKKNHRKEIQELKDRNQEQEERHEEDKQLKEVVEELREMIECPVCLMVPRQGEPVPHYDICLLHSFIYPFLHLFIYSFKARWACAGVQQRPLPVQRLQGPDQARC